MKHKLNGIPETLLISARARYIETKRGDGIINDPKTVEILDAIGHDFSIKKEVSKGSQIGTAIRTEILDEQTSLFLKKNPDAVVVNLGCGLDTRFHRLDNGKVNWFDLDVPETIAVRKQFFSETERFHFVSESILDDAWVELIPPGKSTLFIAEGLLMYFTEKQVRYLLENISKHFKQAEILLEAMSPIFAKNSRRHPDIKKYDASFKWGIKSGKNIEKWNIGLKFIAEWFYFDRYRSRQPLAFRLMTLVPAFRKSFKIINLQIAK